MMPNIYKFNIGSDFVIKANQAIEGFINEKSNETIRIALSGGSSPKEVYKKLGESKKIDWSRIELYQVDERYTPNNHEASNAKLIVDTIVRHHTSLKAFHTFDTTASIENALSKYELLLSKLPQPRFDLVILGLGKDGHTASLFPYGVELEECEKIALNSKSPNGIKERLSLSFPAIMSSQKIIFLIRGADKKDIFEKWLSDDSRVKEVPAKAILDHSNVDIYYDYS